MSRKRKQRKPGRQRAPTALERSAETFETTAKSALANGHFKEAVQAYKVLLKEERRPEWLAALAEAYAGRAQSLVAKGMFKEAAVIWEQRATTCDTPLAQACYIVWLTQAGKCRQAIKLYCDQHERLEQTGDLKRLREYLAALALSGDTDWLDALPTDDPIRRDAGTARAALRAYGVGDDRKLEDFLKAIPFRSPFRDFRQIVKALATLERDRAESIRVLDRIDTDSPFSGLARDARIGTLSGRDLVLGLSALNHEHRPRVAALHGWSAQRVKLIGDLPRLGDPPRPDELMKWLVRHRSVFGEAFSRETCLRVLIHHPQGLPMFRRAFGDASPQEVLRAEALAEELADDPYAAEDAWRDLLEELSACLDEEDNRLRSALILRHLADISPGQRVMGVKDDTSSVQDLAESLLLDPEDRPTHLRLIAAYRRSGKLKEAREALQEALDRFPEAADVLLEAVETAIAGFAFKKAARYARAVLDIDPINPRVKDIVLYAHLAHARKQIRSGSYDLARKELATAGGWAQSTAAQGRVLLLHGLMAVESEGIEAAKDSLREAVARLGDGLPGQFELLIEAARLELRPEAVLQQVQLPRPKDLATREQVIALIHALKSVVDEQDQELLDECLEPLWPALTYGAKLAFTEKEYELICETLHQHESFQLLQQYANEALKRHRKQPGFVYQHLYGKCQGFSWDLSYRDKETLEEALEQAQALGDMRTTHRIIEFLKPPFLPPLPEKAPPLPADMDADFLDMISDMSERRIMDLLRGSADPRAFDALINIIGEQKFAKLVQALAAGQDPKEAFEELIEPPIERRRRPGRGKRRSNRNQGDLFE